MRVLAFGDTHFRYQAPERRCDAYYAEQFRKFRWGLELGKKKGCDVVIQPGDFFDSAVIPYRVVHDVMMMLKDQPLPVLTVFGQHDTRYHSGSTQENTPLGILKAAGVVNVLSSTEEFLFNGVGFLGINWFDKFPEKPSLEHPTVVVVHRMVSNGPLWPGHTDFYTPDQLLRAFPSWVRLIVCGDNHKSFTFLPDDGRRVVNCGSMMRMKTDQLEHRPMVVIYDVEQGSIDIHYIPIDPIDEVFDLERMDRDRSTSQELETFVEALPTMAMDGGMDFRTLLLGRARGLEKKEPAVAGVLRELLEGENV